MLEHFLRKQCNEFVELKILIFTNFVASMENLPEKIRKILETRFIFEASSKDTSP